MSTLQLSMLCFTALALAVIYAGTRARAVEPPLVSEGRVSLSLDSGQTVEGAVLSGPAGFVTLVGATLRTPGVGQPTTMTGAVRLRESSITLVQELDAPRHVLPSELTAERNGHRTPA